MFYICYNGKWNGNGNTVMGMGGEWDRKIHSCTSLAVIANGVINSPGYISCQHGLQL